MAISVFQTVQSFVQFLWNWNLTGGKLVDQNTANIRASICASCHANKPSSEVNQKVCCGGNRIAIAAIEAARSQIIKDQKTTSDSALLTCSICGCDNRISVWIPNDILISPDEANAYPQFCWKKARLENRNL